MFGYSIEMGFIEMSRKYSKFNVFDSQIECDDFVSEVMIRLREYMSNEPGTILYKVTRLNQNPYSLVTVETTHQDLTKILNDKISLFSIYMYKLPVTIDEVDDISLFNKRLRRKIKTWKEDIISNKINCC